MADPTDEQIFALKLLIRYLRERARGRMNDTKIVATTTCSVSDLTNLMNKKPGTRAAAKRYEQLVKRVISLYDEDKDPSGYPDFVGPALAYLRAEGGASPVATTIVPISKPLTDLSNWSSLSQDEVDRSVHLHAGMWYLVRISSSTWTNPDLAEFNVSLLDIFPVGKSRNGMPEFKQYILGKHQSRNAYESYFGYLVIGEQWINFIGRKEPIRAAPIVLMTAGYSPYVDGNHHFEMRGQFSGPSTDNSHISGYFFAEFIENTENIPEMEFESTKQNLRKNIGVKTLDELNGIIRNRAAVEHILAWSKEESLFRSTH